MNRLQLQAWITDVANPADLGEEIELRSPEQPEFAYSLFHPLHYEPNYAYPLVVWLHSAADDERQLQRVMPHVSMRNYVAISPRGSTYRDGQPGFDWGNDAESIWCGEERIMECISLVRDRFNIATDRIFLAGLQTGATMAFRVAFRYPEKFGGVLAIGGAFPSGRVPLREWTRLRRLPVFLAHGRDAVRYPIEAACRDLRLLHSAGLKVTLRQYPCEDDLTTQMLADANLWMMERVTGVSLESTSPSLDEVN